VFTAPVYRDKNIEENIFLPFFSCYGAPGAKWNYFIFLEDGNSPFLIVL
jgi:hypothetical protein